jgi:hypothetical protein
MVLCSIRTGGSTPSSSRRCAPIRAPQEVVVAVFETERLRLTERAKVKRFVDVLAEKRAKRALEQNER